VGRGTRMEVNGLRFKKDSMIYKQNDRTNEAKADKRT